MEKSQKTLMVIDDEETESLVDDLLLNFARQLVPGFVRGIGAVEKERRTGGGNLEDVHLLQQMELVAGDESRPSSSFSSSSR